MNVYDERPRQILGAILGERRLLRVASILDALR